MHARRRRRRAPVDVRFVAATNRDLEAEVARGAFRQDLYFRLNGITLDVPPLRERRAEIAAARARRSRRARARAAGRGRRRRSRRGACGARWRYAWPGNVRELRNVIERAVLLVGGRAHRPRAPRRGARAGPPLAVVRAGRR